MVLIRPLHRSDQQVQSAVDGLKAAEAESILIWRLSKFKGICLQYQVTSMLLVLDPIQLLSKMDTGPTFFHSRLAGSIWWSSPHVKIRLRQVRPGLRIDFLECVEFLWSVAFRCWLCFVC